MLHTPGCFKFATDSKTQINDFKNWEKCYFFEISRNVVLANLKLSTVCQYAVGHIIIFITYDLWLFMSICSWTHHYFQYQCLKIVDVLLQLSLFVTKLTETQIGFTAGGLMVIKRELILTVNKTITAHIQFKKK